MKTCPNCKAKIADQFQLCENCGYHFNKVFDKENIAPIKKNTDNKSMEEEKQFIEAFAKKWGVDKDFYNYLLSEEGQLCTLDGGAGVSEYRVYAFNLNQSDKEKILHWNESSTISEAITYWTFELDTEDFFIDWSCFEINLDLKTNKGDDIDIEYKVFDYDSLTIEEKIKIELKHVGVFEKYEYVLLLDEFRKGEHIGELFKIQKKFALSNFDNAIEIDGEIYYFYDMNVQQWKVKDRDYTFYKISNDLELIGEEKDFIVEVSKTFK